jgi:hypothetical protein
MIPMGSMVGVGVEVIVRFSCATATAMTKIEEDFGCVEGWMFQQLISCEIN